MSNYYLQSIVLQNCPYSNAAAELLNKHSNINKEIISISADDKEYYKTSHIDTFPQIYLKKKYKTGSFLIGGYSELRNLFELFHNKKYSHENIKKFIDTNKNWSKKALLRFIELINL